MKFCNIDINKIKDIKILKTIEIYSIKIIKKITYVIN